MSKTRLDIAVFEQNLTESREKARALIMEGKVYVDGQKCDKPGTAVSENSKVELVGEGCPYVSRGGLKLKKALDEFGADVYNKVALDIGSSTGGFTDCLLQSGAKKVFAVDSGTAQLAYKLRMDERVIVMEKTNFRYLEQDKITEDIDIAVMDVSFISAVKLIDNLKNFMGKDTTLIILIKPQFEALRTQVGKGVVSNAATHIEILTNVINDIENKNLQCMGLTYSPIKGPKGNIEFLAEFVLKDSVEKTDTEQIKICVKNAHEALR